MNKLSLWEAHRREVQEMLLDGHTHQEIGDATNRCRSAITRCVSRMRENGTLHHADHGQRDTQILGIGEL